MYPGSAGASATPSTTNSWPITITSALSGKPPTQIPCEVSRSTVTGGEQGRVVGIDKPHAQRALVVQRQHRLRHQVRLDASRRDQDLGGLAVTDRKVAIGHLDLDAEGAGGGIGGPAEEGDLPGHLAAIGKPRPGQRAGLDAVDLGFRHETHQLDRIKLDDGGAVARAGSAHRHQAAQLGSVGFQQPVERGGDAQLGNVQLDRGHGGLCRLDRGLDPGHARARRFQRRLRGAHGGLGAAHPGLCRGNAGFAGKAAFRQLARGVVVDPGFFKLRLGLGQTGLGLGDAGLGFGDAGAGLGQAGLGLGKSDRAGARVKPAEFLPGGDETALAQRLGNDLPRGLGLDRHLPRRFRLAPQHHGAVDGLRGGMLGDDSHALCNRRRGFGGGGFGRLGAVAGKRQQGFPFDHQEIQERGHKNGGQNRNWTHERNLPN